MLDRTMPLETLVELQKQLSDMQAELTKEIETKRLDFQIKFNQVINEKLSTPQSHCNPENHLPDFVLTESDRIGIFREKEELLNKLGFQIIDNPKPGKYTPYLLKAPADAQNFSLKDGARGGKIGNTVFLLNGIEVLTVREINNYGYRECYLFLADKEEIEKALKQNTANQAENETSPWVKAYPGGFFEGKKIIHTLYLASARPSADNDEDCSRTPSPTLP